MTPNQEKFKQVYLENLKLAVIKYPDEYRWPVENVPVVAEKMLAAVARNTFNHDSQGFKMTCKALGIKHTRKAILSFWNGVKE
jgi:hypothetical protein